MSPSCWMFYEKISKILKLKQKIRRYQVIKLLETRLNFERRWKKNGFYLHFCFSRCFTSCWTPQQIIPICLFQSYRTKQISQDSIESCGLRSGLWFKNVMKWWHLNKMEGRQQGGGRGGGGEMCSAAGIRGLEAAEVMSLARARGEWKTSLPLYSDPLCSPSGGRRRGGVASGCPPRHRGCWEMVKDAKQAPPPTLEAHIFVLWKLVCCQRPHFSSMAWLHWM